MKLFLSLTCLVYLSTDVFGQSLINQPTDSCRLVKSSLKTISGEWLLECGYFKGEKIIYFNEHAIPFIYKSKAGKNISIKDTGYLFISNPSRFFEPYHCPEMKSNNYYVDFIPLLNSNNEKVDSFYVKGIAKKAKANFGSRQVDFLYKKFSATITYFEDYSNYYSQLVRDYYDFDKRNTKLLTEGNYPVRYVISVTIN